MIIGQLAGSTYNLEIQEVESAYPDNKPERGESFSREKIMVQIKYLDKVVRQGKLERPDVIGCATALGLDATIKGGLLQVRGENTAAAR